MDTIIFHSRLLEFVSMVVIFLGLAFVSVFAVFVFEYLIPAFFKSDDGGDYEYEEYIKSRKGK